jgi:hypothetical protein
MFCDPGGVEMIYLAILFLAVLLCAALWYRMISEVIE